MVVGVSLPRTILPATATPNERYPEAGSRVLEIFEVNLAIEHVLREAVQLEESQGERCDYYQCRHARQCATRFQSVTVA